MIKKITLFCLVCLFLAVPLVSLADKCIGGTQCTGMSQTNCSHIAGCSWAAESTNTTANSSSSSCPGNSCTLTNPLGTNSPQALIGRVINSVLGIVGSLALLMFVYGGLTWMTSSGSPEKIKKGRDIILWSALGLVVIFMSYALTKFILSTIVQ